MDLITHVLVTYLVTLGVVGFQPQYLAAGALAGGLPDADALLYPLGRRFEIFQHRGITHSFLGVTIIAIAGALIAPLLLPGSFLLYFAVMEMGGLLHIGLDAFTNFSVPPLLPFSRQRICYDADRAVNFFTLVVSVVSMYVLLGVERNQVAIQGEWASIAVLGVFFGAYFAIRVATRAWLGRAKSRFGPFDHIVPTENPFTWFLYGERRAGDRVSLHFARYRTGRGISGPYALTVDPAAATRAGPIASEQEAIDRSYAHRHARGRFFEDTYLFARAEPTPPGGWQITWYSIEFVNFGRSASVQVLFPPDGGAPEVHRGFRRVRMPWADRPPAT